MKKASSVNLLKHNMIAYQRVKEMWLTDKRVAVVQATGTGKSYIVFKVLEDFKDEDKIVLAPSVHILEQLEDNLKKYCDKPKLMTYAKAMTLSDEELYDLGNIKLIILDEFHRCGAKEWGDGINRILKLYPDAYVLGTTATHIRYLDNQRNMAQELFNDNIAVELSLVDAIIKNILPMPKYISALYTLDDEIKNIEQKINNSSNSVDEKEKLLKEIKKFKQKWDRSKGVPKILSKYISKRSNKFIVFCKNKNHLLEMENLVESWFRESKIKKPIKKYRVISEESSSKKELESFRESKDTKSIHLLFSINMLNEGIHIEDVDGVILLRPTVSPIIFYQQIGRSLQVGKKKNPLILDLVNNFNNIGSLTFLQDLENSKRYMEKRTSVVDLDSDDYDLKDISPDFTIIDETREALNLFKFMESRLLDCWEHRYEELEQYNHRYGNCLVPFRFNENEALGIWVANQRVLYSKKLLSKEKIDKLEKFGFVWDANEYIWYLRYDELKKYIEQFKDCLVPKRYKNKELGNWVATQRELYKKGDLAKDKIKKLNELNFVWVVAENSWNVRYEELLDYKSQYEDCLVPFNYIDKKLANWVRKQRQNYKQGKLPEGRINMLNEIDFVWDARQR